MSSDRSDLELLEAWRGGDLEAADILVQRHFDRLYRFFHRRVDEGVADLVQRTWAACVEKRDRIPAFLFAAELEVGDVDPGIAQRRADEADHARNVGVGDVDHVGTDIGVEVDALDLNEARLAVGKDRAGDRTGLVGRLHRQLDVAVEDA